MPEIGIALIGLFGALVGGLLSGFGSYLGGKKSSDDNIKVQKELYNQSKKEKENEFLQQLKISMYVVENEIFIAFYTGFKLLCSLRDVKGSNEWNERIIPFNPQQITVILQSKHLNSDELILINTIYGYIERIRSLVLRKTQENSILLNNTIRDTYSYLLSLSFEASIKEEIISRPLNEITIDYIKGCCNPITRRLLDKIDKLKDS